MNLFIFVRGTTMASLKKVVNIFNGTGSYTASAGVTSLFVECIGGGQSGQAAVSSQQAGSAGNGGDAGSYAAFHISSSLLVATGYPVSVGAGGAAPSPGSNQNNGADTTFTSGSTVIVLAPGGGSTSTPVGDTTILGTDGHAGNNETTVSGAGSPGPWGGGARAQQAGAGPIDGKAGKGFGSGGSGGASRGDMGKSTGAKGGAGANGLIRVWEYI